MGDLVQMPAEQWLRVRNLGRNSLAEVAEAVSKLGAAIKMPSYPSAAEQPLPEKTVEETPAPALKPTPVEIKPEPVKEDHPEENESRSIPLAELGLPQNAYFALLQRGVETAGDIADLTPFAWKQMKQLKQNEIVAIQAKLKELGLRIKK